MYHMTDIMAKPEEFERTAIRMVLGKSASHRQGHTTMRALFTKYCRHCILD
jgi:hypothetical protein